MRELITADLRGPGRPRVDIRLQQIRKAFTLQRLGARDRGIAFLLTFEQWKAWWEAQLGPDWFAMRGVGYGKYCMARYGDAGPYKLGNIKCMLHVENHREGNLGKQHALGYRHTEEAKQRIGAASKQNKYGAYKLRAADIPRIRRAKGTNREVAQRFGISSSFVCMIKNGQRWGDK
jgi:hypothetical protein